MSDEHDDDCGCAVCATHIMGPFDDWVPEHLPPGTVRRCTFCRVERDVDYFNPLGFPFCHDCSTRKESP